MKQRLLVAAVALGLLIAVGATTVSAQTGVDGFQVAGGVELESTIDVAKSLTGRLAETDPSLLGRTSSNMINVIVKLDYDPARRGERLLDRGGLRKRAHVRAAGEPA